MGNAVSSGVNNDDLVNNLVEEKYITSKLVEQVFRAVDRGHFVADSRDNESNSTSSAYDDLAWREGNLHLSAPCIYTHVMEELDLKPGMSFLNLGSGTGYLSLMVGHIIGPLGCNHGVEIHQDCIEYAKERIAAFVHTSKHFDKFTIGFPEFFQGNCLCLSAADSVGGGRYDRVYCGAAVPPEHIAFIRQFVKPGGILILPCEDQLVKVLVKEDSDYEMQNILPVSFASLVVPSGSEAKNAPSIQLPLKQVSSLKSLVRTAIRQHVQTLVFPEGAVRVKPSPLTRSEKAKRSQMSVRESIMRVRGRLRNSSRTTAAATAATGGDPDQGPGNPNRDRRPTTDSNNEEGNSTNVVASEMDPLLPPQSNNGESPSPQNGQSSATGAAVGSTECHTAGFEANGQSVVTLSGDAQCSNKDSSIGPSTSKDEKSASEIPVTSSVVDAADGESSNDSLDKNFKLFTVKNDAETSNFTLEQSKTLLSGTAQFDEEGCTNVFTRDPSADSQDGSPNEAKRIKMTSTNEVTNQNEAVETANQERASESSDVVNEHQQGSVSNGENSSSAFTTTPEVTVQEATSARSEEDSSNVEETRTTSASTYDLEIDESSDPEIPVDFLHNEIVNAVRSTFTVEEPEGGGGGVPFPLRFLLDARRINMGVHLDDTNSRLATESSDLEEEDNGRGGDGDDLDSEPDNDSEASCEDASEYEESAPAAAVLNPQAVLPVNQEDAQSKDDTKLSCSNDSGFKTLSSTYSNEAQNSSPGDEITCTRRKRKKAKRSAEAKKDDSGLWVRHRIEKLDLPPFLIDYLLYNRK